jgi:hypothetical protein
MTNTPPEPNNPPNVPHWSTRFFNPRSLLIFGGAIAAITTAAYLGVRYFVYENLSGVLETQLSNILQRPVKVGKVEKFQLNRLRLGASAIPATPTDADNLDIQAIDVRFNPLPLLVGRPLTVDVVIVDPNIYLEQDKDGRWIAYDFPTAEKREPLPLNFDVRLKVEDGNIGIKPQAATKPLTIEASGEGRYLKAKNQEIEYDFDGLILNNKFQARGTSILETGKNIVDLSIQELNLAQILGLFPNLPVQLKRGIFGADLALNLPSFEEIEQTQGQGKVLLRDWLAQTQVFKDPLHINTELALEGQTVRFTQGKVGLGKAQADIQGGINWARGYDLDINIKSFDLPEFLGNISVKSPVSLIANFNSNIKVTGKLEQPLLTGTIINNKPVILDKIPFQNVKTDFQTNLDNLLVKNFQARPQAGGTIVGSGSLKIGVLQALKQSQEIDPKKMLLQGEFKTTLPTQKIISPYVSFPQDVQVGDIQAQVKVGGTWAKPQGLLKWQAPQNSLAGQVAIAGAGEVELVKDNLIVRNTSLQAGAGTLFLNGVGNLARQNWQTEIRGQNFPLDPFLGLVCDRNPTNCTYLQANQPYTIENLQVNLTGTLKEVSASSINGVANLKLNTSNGNLALSSQVNQGYLTAFTTARQFSLNPFVNVPVSLNLDQARVNLAGSVAPLLRGDFSQLTAKANLGLLVDQQALGVRGNLNGGIIQANLQTLGLNLNPFAPNLNLPLRLGNTQANLSGNLAQLQTGDINAILNSLNAQGKTELFLDNQLVRAQGSLNNGAVQAIASNANLNLNKFLPQLPLPIQARQTRVKVNGRVNELFRLAQTSTPDLRALQITANSQLALAQGKVNLRANLLNNEWQSQANFINLNPSLLLGQKLPLAPLNGAANLRGNINNLFAQNPSIPVNISGLTLNSGEQRIQTQGSLLVTNPLQSIDIQNLNLALLAQTDLSKLPLTQLLALAPVDPVLLPNLNITGKGEFQGQVRGNNLISQLGKAGTLELDGNLKLANFSFNNREFEPVLTGKLQAGLGEKIALDLYGQVDVIAAAVEPCTRKDCVFPYLPLGLEIKQTANTKAPLLVTGKRQGDRFQASIEQFPLEVLQIKPLQNYNILGVFGGTLKATADVDLFRLDGQGTIQVDSPGIGSVAAELFRADVRYKNRIARLDSGVFKFGKSQLEARGFLNFETQEILAKVGVEEGHIEDVFRTLQISTIDRLLKVLRLKEASYATAQGIQPQPIRVGDAEGDLAQQVNRLTMIDRQIRAIADKLDSGTTFTELDIRGIYSTQIALAGTLANPRIDTQFQGNNWQWYAQQPFPDIVSPLGLVMREDQFIPIDLISLNASFQDGKVAIKPAQLKIREALAEFQGNLSLDSNQAQFRLSNLSIDELRNYFALPLDLSGYVNLEGTLSGSIVDPEVKGVFAFTEGAVNARMIEQEVTGTFNYNQARLKLQTDPSPALDFYASIPFPLQADINDNFEIIAQLKTPAMQLLPAFTQGQINWLGGEGRANFKANGRIDNRQELKLKEFQADGVVILENASLKTAAFPEILTLNGRIRLAPEYLNVEELSGNLENSQIALRGVLPFFQPIKNNPNPLTLTLQNSQIELPNLYKGGINGEIIIGGTAFNQKAPPLVSGGILLERGQVFIPKNESQVQVNGVINRSLTTRWAGTLDNSTPVVNPRLDNFQVSLKSLKISQAPLYEFAFGGDIVLDGPLSNPDNLQAQGAIRLNQGRFGFLNTRFVLNRRHNNLITFAPNQGLLNPYINIQMRSIITDTPNTVRDALGQQRGELSNEIPDNSLTRVQRVDVTLSLQGELQELLPDIRRGEGDVCRYRPSDLPIPTETELLANQERIIACVERMAAASQAGKNDLISKSSALTLTSSPPRSEGEIVRLLGEQIFIFVDSFQGKNSSQLLQDGVIGLAVPLLLQGYIYDVENAIADTINAADFNILPNLQAVYRVSSEGFVRFSYDYNFNEVTVRYETRF